LNVIGRKNIRELNEEFFYELLKLLNQYYQLEYKDLKSHSKTGGYTRKGQARFEKDTLQDIGCAEDLLNLMIEEFPQLKSKVMEGRLYHRVYSQKWKYRQKKKCKDCGKRIMDTSVKCNKCNLKSGLHPPIKADNKVDYQKFEDHRTNKTDEIDNKKTEVIVRWKQ
jgi:hypothetical protein